MKTVQSKEIITSKSRLKEVLKKLLDGIDPEESPVELCLETHESVEVHAKVNQEYQFMGSILLKKGLFLWEYDRKKKTLNKAEIKGGEGIVNMQGDEINKKRVERNPHGTYVQALNKQNAIKKVAKALNLPEAIIEAALNG